MVRTTRRGAVARLGATVLGAALLLGSCGDEPAMAPGEDASNDEATAAAPPGRTVDPQEALALVAEDATVVDVRTPEEFAAGHVAGAVNLDLQSEDFLTEVRALPAGERYVVYCATGNRSAQAVDLMAGEGLGELYDAGGFEALAGAGADVARGAAG